MKVADVKLSWKKSVSSDIAKVVLTIVNNGATETVELGPEIEEYQVVVKASTSLQFSVTSEDTEGQEVTSTTYSFTLGDLEAPQPATDLTHTVLGIRDVEDSAPPA